MSSKICVCTLHEVVVAVRYDAAAIDFRLALGHMCRGVSIHTLMSLMVIPYERAGLERREMSVETDACKCGIRRPAPRHV